MEEVCLQIDMVPGTEFQKRVWKSLLTIPYGETITYLELAKRLNMPRAFRAVANAVGKNPLLVLVPCHRVVRSDGGLGGYSGPGGVEAKRMLLLAEGVVF